MRQSNVLILQVCVPVQGQWVHVNKAAQYNVEGLFPWEVSVYCGQFQHGTELPEESLWTATVHHHGIRLHHRLWADASAESTVWHPEASAAAPSVCQWEGNGEKQKEVGLTQGNGESSKIVVNLYLLLTDAKRWLI